MGRVARFRLGPSCAAVAVILMGVYAEAGGLTKTAPKVNPDAQIVAEFQKRLADYVKLQKNAAAQLPSLKPTDSPAKIDEYQKALAERIRAARPEARQCSIFDPRIAGEFRRLIRIAQRGSHDKLIRASLRRGEPVSLTVSPNEPYPEKVPLETTPPSLLLNLPELPPELDYRVVNHDLVLRDVKANLIVDFVPRAIPYAGPGLDKLNASLWSPFITGFDGGNARDPLPQRKCAIRAPGVRRRCDIDRVR